jgi:ATP-dependent Clp protease ATP-binding subunit ClpA
MGLFDRFTDRAKRVLALSQDEAVRFNHNYIGPEHLLLGLIREGEGVAARALDSLGVKLSEARTAVESKVGRGGATTPPSEITLMPRTKKIIELANDEARTLGHSHVGTEHLLLGLVRESGTMASEVLESLGVSLDKARQHVTVALELQQRQHQQQHGADSRGTPISPFDRLDNEAKRILSRAYWEAGWKQEERIGPEHLLLALIADDSAWLRSAWKELDVDLEDLSARIDGAAQAPREASKRGRLTPSAELSDVVIRASSFAAERNSALIRPEHLLLGIAADGQGIAVTWLRAVGVTAERVREVVDKHRP